MPLNHPMHPADAVAHLNPEHWQRANRSLIRKALAEFAHERLLVPVPQGNGEYTVGSDDGAVEYRFAARRSTLDHWHIDGDSIARRTDGEPAPLDALEFCIELRGALGLTDQILPVYLEEISSTLASTAYKLGKPAMSAAEVAAADFQTIESAMTEGHPCFVANNGRLGFAIDEYRSYAPEAGGRLRLIWVAARRDRATFTHCADIDYDKLIGTELPGATLDRFGATMDGLGLSLSDYYLIPVHPWQWWHKLSVTFAAEVAKRHLVCLGYGDDEYTPQQSIRTFFNRSNPSRHYVKTALSVLNMGFVRGLSAGYMKATPAINDWLADLIARDEVLTGCGFGMLREHAAIGYHHRQYEAAAVKGSPYLKMLAALWRESPMHLLRPGQRPATMASLLHVDGDGRSVTGALIAESGLAPRDWLRRYLDAYLKPLLHCFYAYQLVYMPHGENVILVLADGVPRRAIMKDIAEEIGIMDTELPLPAEVERIRIEVSDELKPLSIFTDVFDCFFRFLAAILDDEDILEQDEFWRAVAECVIDYQASMPHLADRFERWDLFADEFGLSCLNRLQLRNNQQMFDLDNPDAGSDLQIVGTLTNPIARFRDVGDRRVQ